MDPVDRSSLLADINSLENQLEKDGICYEQLAGRTKSNISIFILLVVGFIPFLLGFVLNIIPISISRYFSRTKVKKKEFKAVMKLIPLLAIYPIYLLLLGLFFGGIFSWEAALCIVLFPILGWFSFVYKRHFKEFKASMNYNGLDQVKRDTLLKQYQRILSKLNS